MCASEYIQLDWIPRPATLQSKSPELKCLSYNGASGRGDVVLIAADEEDEGAETEHGSREDKRKPVPHVFFCKYHSNLTNQGTDIDHEVEVEENTSDGLAWVDNDSLSSFGNRLNKKPCLFVLLSNEGCNI